VTRNKMQRIKEQSPLSERSKRAPSGAWRCRTLDYRHRTSPATEDCIMNSFITWTLHQILLGRSNQGLDEWGM